MERKITIRATAHGTQRNVMRKISALATNPAYEDVQDAINELWAYMDKCVKDEDTVPAPYEVLTAVLVAKWFMHHTKDVIEYLIKFALNKRQGRYMPNADKGAFGDLIEVLVRLAAVPRPLWRKEMCHAQVMEKRDIIMGKGDRRIKIEVGHNGKEFTDLEPDEFFKDGHWYSGKYQYLVYGQFTDAELNGLVDLIEQGEQGAVKAVEIVANKTKVYKVTCEQDLPLVVQYRPSNGKHAITYSTKNKRLLEENTTTWADFIQWRKDNK